MRIAFLNPQGNFDPADSYLAEHPDFGGQLVYVKQVALSLAELGHEVDIITRQIQDPAWPEFSSPLDFYPGISNLRIIRLPAGPGHFLRKEHLWPHLGPEWVPNIISFYHKEGAIPDFFSAHYGDGGISAVLLQEETGIPFSFTAHSLGAQKLDHLNDGRDDFLALDKEYFFSRRLVAERTAMNHSRVNITSTLQERKVQYGHPAYQGAVDITNDNRFAVIPPGVNLAVFDKNITSESENETIDHINTMLARDLNQDRLSLPCIIASSRIELKKNHMGLVKAYAMNAELQGATNLVILTSGLPNPLNDITGATVSEQEVLEPLIKFIDENELRGKVTMFSLKGQAALGAAYRFFANLGSIFSLPALHEPFGLAPLEAMAAGLPAVVTKFGGPSESMKQGAGRFGILIDPTNPHEISAAMLALVNNPDLWNQYARAGYNRVASTYNWKKTASAYLDIITKNLNMGGLEENLPIHPFFTDPKERNEINLADLGLIL